ncbi:MAG TPA: SusC/RagA family TonB-linked outer membrane protein, partial [Pontibacter sp.]
MKLLLHVKGRRVRLLAHGHYRVINSPSDVLRIMKITAVFLLVACLQVSATAFSQKITITAKNESLDKVFREINKQSGYLFLYNNEALQQARPVTVQANGVELKEVLDACFENQPLTYTITDKTIVVKQRERSLKKPQTVQTDTITVRGQIINKETKEPLIGASVLVKGSNRGVSTDATGRFTLKAKKGDILFVMYLGYKPQELPLSESSTVSIAMEPNSVRIDEVSVVATGYQQVEREKLTGSVASISQKQFDQRVAVTGNFLENLEGKIPGLMYNNQTGELAIRGVSTFDAVKQPLIVLNGFPTEIDIRNINPNDIISVNVLKDAAAASIYGTRASNGVIVIETKRGKAGKPTFSLRSTYGVQAKPDFSYLNYGNAASYALIERDNLLASTSTRASVRPGIPVSPVADVVYDFKAGLIDESTMNNRLAAIGNYDNLKQYEDLFYRTRVARQLDFDVSGGNEKNTYMLGVNYMDEDHQEVETNDKRVLLNFSSYHNFTDRINFDFRGSYSNMKQANPYNSATSYISAGGFNPINNFLPYERLADENGVALPVSLGPNRNAATGITLQNNEINKGIGLYDQLYYPYRELFASTNTSETSSVRFQGRLNAEITDWLSFDIGGAYEDQPTNHNILLTEEAFAVRRLLNYKAKKDPTTGLPVFSDIPRGAFLTRVNEQTKGYTFRSQFNINHTSADRVHAISGIVGTEVRKTTTSLLRNTFFGYDGQTLIVKPVNFVELSSIKDPAFPTLPTLNRASFLYDTYFGEEYDDRRFVSFYGNGTYMLMDRYVLTGSIRFDKSNLFGTDPKYKNRPFYSIGANWNLDREEFVQGIDWISELKLRTAYGLNGNIPTSNNGPFLLLESGLNYSFYPAPSEQYYDILSPENQSIRWEETKNYNAGLDYALFNSSIYGTFDLYFKNSDDVFGAYSSDPTTGFNQYRANTASIRNRGIEFSINSLNASTDKFAWRTQVTASFNKNEVTAVKTTANTGGEPLISALQIQKGYPIDALFGYRYAGLNELGQPQIYTKEGNTKLLEMGGFGDENVTLDDMQYMGTTTPKYVLGLNNQF